MDSVLSALRTLSITLDAKQVFLFDGEGSPFLALNLPIDDRDLRMLDLGLGLLIEEETTQPPPFTVVSAKLGIVGAALGFDNLYVIAGLRERNLDEAHVVAGLATMSASVSARRVRFPSEAVEQRPQLGRLPGLLNPDTQFLSVTDDPLVRSFFSVNEIAIDEVVSEVRSAQHRVSTSVAHRIYTRAQRGADPAKTFALKTLVGCLEADTAVAAAVRQRSALPVSELLARHLGGVPAATPSSVRARLIALDDEFTAQEFVHSLFLSQFNMERDEATAATERIEKAGSSEVAEGPTPMIERLRDSATRAAREAGFPLRLYVQPVEDA